MCFFFQAEDGIRDLTVTGVQTCALPILNDQDADVKRTRVWQETVHRTVEAVAGLTAVDGATVITNRYELLAFGAKIARRKGSPQVEQLTVTEPIEGDVAQVLHPTQLGGT